MPTILVLNGPNLDLLGVREPETYGTGTLSELAASLDRVAAELSVDLEHFQANGEGALVDRVHEAWRSGVSGLLVNAGAYTHTSIALRDALLAVQLPFVEIHLSNVWRRESFRHHSLLADVAIGVVAGLGPAGYELALRGLVAHL